MRRRALVPLVVLALGLLAAGCGDDDDEPTSADATTTTAAPDGGDTATEPDDIAATDPSSPSATDPNGDEGTTSTTEGETDEPGTTDPEDLPGEPIDIYPYEGAALAVVGVAADDTLNVRSGPGTSFDVVTELAPLADGFTATGHNRTVDESFWVEVEADGERGWINGSFQAQLGSTRDITGEVEVRPEGSSPADIARDVAAQRAGTGEPTPTITVIDEQGTTEATVDLVGFGDDAQTGERLRVTVSGETVTVEATALCSRGVSDGLCV